MKRLQLETCVIYFYVLAKIVSSLTTNTSMTTATTNTINGCDLLYPPKCPKFGPIVCDQISAGNFYYCYCAPGYYFNITQNACLTGKYLYNFTISLTSLTFTPKLAQKGSALFIDYSENITTVTNAIFGNTSGYLGSTVLSFSNGSINAVVLTCWYEPVNTVIINENIQQYITADCTKQTCFGFQSNVSYLGSNVTDYCKQGYSCPPNTQCVNNHSSFGCDCIIGYQSIVKFTFYNFTINICQLIPLQCLHGGKTNNYGTCLCPWTYSGNNCDNNTPLIFVTAVSVIMALLTIFLVTTSILLIRLQKKHIAPETVVRPTGQSDQPVGQEDAMHVVPQYDDGSVGLVPRGSLPSVSSERLSYNGIPRSRERSPPSSASYFQAASLNPLTDQVARSNEISNPSYLSFQTAIPTTSSSSSTFTIKQRPLDRVPERNESTSRSSSLQPAIPNQSLLPISSIKHPQNRVPESTLVDKRLFRPPAVHLQASRLMTAQNSRDRPAESDESSSTSSYSSLRPSIRPRPLRTRRD